MKSIEEVIKRLQEADTSISEENTVPHTTWIQSAIREAIELLASQPPSGNLWEEVDAVKEPPGEGIYFVHAPGWQKMCRASFEFGKWIDRDFDINGYYEKDITEHVTNYLRPVTGQRYSEEDVEKAFKRGYSLGHEGALVDGGWYQDPCWQTYKHDNKIQSLKK